MSGSNALAPPASNTPRRSSRSPRRRKKGKGKGKKGDADGAGGDNFDNDDASSRASSVSPAPSPAPSSKSPGGGRSPGSAPSTPLPSALKKRDGGSATSVGRSPLSASIDAKGPPSTKSGHPFPDVAFMRHIIEPRTPPLHLLNNPLSHWFRHVQPLLLVGYFVARFPALVADPVGTLASDSIVVGALQLAWCMACVPPYASLSSSSSSSQQSKLKSKGSRGRLRPDAIGAGGAGAVGVKGDGQSHHNQNPGISARLTTALLSLPLAVAASIPLLVLVVLFGAPATTHGWHTALLSLHMALLGALPLVYARGVDQQAWWEAAGLLLPADAVTGSAGGACVGAWLGAIPIPLDWDRDWQNWPITIVAGAYIGSVAGRYVGDYLMFGRRVRMESDDMGEEDSHAL